MWYMYNKQCNQITEMKVTRKADRDSCKRVLWEWVLWEMILINENVWKPFKSGSFFLFFWISWTRQGLLGEQLFYHKQIKQSFWMAEIEMNHSWSQLVIYFDVDTWFTIIGCLFQKSDAHSRNKAASMPPSVTGKIAGEMCANIHSITDILVSISKACGIIWHKMLGLIKSCIHITYGVV